MQEQPIIAPVPADLIRRELTRKLFLRTTNKADNEIYIFKAADAPNVMREVGRLREEAFRYYGGGTGRELDIDEFDTDPEGYMQLIVWDPAEQAILGGYRFIFGSDVRLSSDGRPHLATGEMFHFSPQFVEEYLPHTIELGRSFVSLPYQSTLMGAKSMFALDNLWDGIGALTVLNPDMKYFYGKVTMYRNYNRYARNLILYFLDKHFHDHEHLVVPIEPLPIEVDPDCVASLFPSDNFKQNYRALNKEVRRLGINIPPLVSAYMSLSPEMRVFGTAINHEFGEVEETGILIAVDKILEEKRARHILSFRLTREHRRSLWDFVLRRVGLVRR
ncbi:GNAT family N-acetyltransferase [Porphyromonas sp. COT-239 OH1446]|uniref:GNAT family N-acetyltransferase n=1 Tax=Porphyromonas sp. COT-239 OH1446 TaxID=1515613 RepID=UPI00052E2BA7|nr:GNAT family N-acetyltransferase [Porphyromonas sp. COT-239 OH1446]KGN71511.1 hemolysin [Porphyromonas sp. COT-239 OH1446]